MYHNNHSRTFKNYYIATEILFILLAIVMGFVFKVQPDNSFDEEHFNWGLAIIFYLSSVPIAVVLYAIYSHLENQEIQINLIGRIIENLETKEDKKQFPPASIANVTQNKTIVSNGYWCCKKCQEKNPTSSQFCKNCGEYR